MIALLTILLTLSGYTEAISIDTDVQGNIYVLDRGRSQLIRYTPGGDSAGVVGGYGTGPGQFDRPAAVCVAGGNDVYVADYNNHRVQRFTRNLDYINTIYTRDDPNQESRFGYPADVAVDRFGQVYVLDGENKRIVVFDQSGVYRRTFGRTGPSYGSLQTPTHLALDQGDNIYVLDGTRIISFDPFGNYLNQYTITLATHPRGIGISEGNIIISDSSTLYRIYIGQVPAGNHQQQYLGQFPVGATSMRFTSGAVYATDPKHAYKMTLP